MFLLSLRFIDRQIIKSKGFKSATTIDKQRFEQYYFISRAKNQVLLTKPILGQSLLQLTR